MTKSTFTTAMVAAFLVFSTYACSQGQQSSTDASAGAAPSSSGSELEAAATVNGQPVYVSELETAVRNVVMQNGMDATHLDAFMGQFGPRILDQLIDGELLYQAAKKAGTEASEEDVEAAFAELSGRYAAPEQFEAEMEARGFTEASLKSNIEEQLTIQRFIEQSILPEADVPEETIRQAYDENPGNFTREEEVTASHILIKSAQSDPQEKKDAALKKAEEVAAMAKAKDADFAELARTHSEGPSAPSGGSLGPFTRGRMVKPFEDAAFSLKIGQVSDPVLTQFGYHIIKVTDRKEGGTVTYEEAHDQLEQDLKNRMVNELIGMELKKLRDKAEIEILFKPEPQSAPPAMPQGTPAN